MIDRVIDGLEKIQTNYISVCVCCDSQKDNFKDNAWSVISTYKKKWSSFDSIQIERFSSAIL